MNQAWVEARQQISQQVKETGRATCLNCQQPTVRMFGEPRGICLTDFYVRCQTCLIFYPGFNE